MQYFCSGRCPRVQTIFVNLFRIFGARNLGVALELSSLKWFSGRKCIFLFYEKYPLGFCWVIQKREGELEVDGSLGWKSRVCPSVQVHLNWSKTPNPKQRQLKVWKKREGKNQAVTWVMRNLDSTLIVTIIHIWTTDTCSNAYKLVEKFKSVSLVAFLGPMQEMGMNVKHPATVTRPQTLRFLVFKFY